MIVLLLMLAQEPEAMIAKARALVAEPPCVPDPNSTDVTVCGRRNADRFRVPLVVPPEPGDPAHEGVPAERERLLHRTNPVQELSPFLVGGGMAGVSATANLGSGEITERPLAP